MIYNKKSCLMTYNTNPYALTTKKANYRKYTTEINGQVVGTLTNNNGVVSGFNTKSNYIITQCLCAPTLDDYWRFVCTFTAGTLADSNQIIGTTVNYNFVHVIVNKSGAVIVYISTNSTSWNVASAVTAFSGIVKGNTYRLKIVGNGPILNIRMYNTADGSLVNSYQKELTARLSQGRLTFGSPYQGYGSSYSINHSIDLKNTYYELNNKVIWRGVTDVEGTSSNYDFIEYDTRRFG